MKKIRLAIQFLVLVGLIVSPLFSLGYQQGTPILQSVGSCSGVSTIGGSLSGDESGEESTGSFITGEPVDIPAPVAKGIDGIDPTSITFEQLGSGNLTKPASYILAQTGSAVGTLSGRTLASGSETVAFFSDGALRETTTASSGSFSFTLYEGDVGTSFALAVYGDNGIDVSTPTLVTLSDIDGNRVISVSVTNVAAGASNFDGDIQNREIAFNGERIAFNVVDSSDKPLIVRTKIDDFTPETLVSDIGVELDFLTYGGDTLFGTDAETESGLIFRISSDGTFIDDSLNLNRPSNRTFCISPDLEWVASNIVVMGQMVIVLDNLQNPPLTSIVVPTSAPEDTVTHLRCDWVDTTSMVVAKAYENFTYTIQYYDLKNVIKGDAINVTPDVIVAQSLTFLAAPDADPAVADRLVFQAGPSSSDVRVWRADPIDGTVEIFNDPVTVGPPRYNADGSGVIFELSTNGDPTDPRNSAIVFVNSDTLEATYLARGVKPMPSPTEKNIIVYLSLVEDTLQIGIINLDNF